MGEGLPHIRTTSDHRTTSNTLPCHDNKPPPPSPHPQLILTAQWKVREKLSTLISWSCELGEGSCPSILRLSHPSCPPEPDICTRPHSRALAAGVWSCPARVQTGLGEGSYSLGEAWI